MPGSNHDIDATFMDALPLSVREAALDLIRFSSLHDMLEFRENGPSDFLQNQFNLTPIQWQQVLNAVILTKVSYFDIQLHFPNRYIDKLIEISASALGMQSADPVSLYQGVIAEHPKFAAWIKKAIQVKQQNIRFAQTQAASA